MFNIIWEFIINLLESFLFAVICNAKFTKRQYHYHTAEQTLFILCKSLLITLMNISKISTIISLTSVLLLNIIFLILFFVNPIFNSFFCLFYLLPDTNNFRCFDFINTNKVLQYKSLAGIIFGKYANTFFLNIYIHNCLVCNHIFAFYPTGVCFRKT